MAKNINIEVSEEMWTQWFKAKAAREIELGKSLSWRDFIDGVIDKYLASL